MKVLRAYKTEIDPNNVQRTLLLKHAGAARFTFNWGLSEKQKAYEAKEKVPNAIELHRRINALKKTDFPWMYDVSKCSPQEALRNLDRAYDNFYHKVKAKKSGTFKGKVGFPRFKSKKSSRKSSSSRHCRRSSSRARTPMWPPSASRPCGPHSTCIRSTCAESLPAMGLAPSCGAATTRAF